MNEISIVKQTAHMPVEFSHADIDLIKKTVAKDATDTELKLFIGQCKRTGLDPITRQIYFIKNPKDGKVQIQVSIDGFRLVADRSGVYEGQTPTQWCGEDGVWKDVWLDKKGLPSAARVGVYKKGFRDALYAVALFDEYAQKNYKGELSFMWNKMPSLMIGKVAESLALRKAFPNDLSGLYTQEEMQQAEDTKEEEEEPRKATVVPVQLAQPTVSQPSELYNPPQPDGWESQMYSQPPVVHTAEVINDEEYVVKFGKFKDKRFTEIDPNDLSGYVDYVRREATATAERENRPIRPQMAEFINKATGYLNSFPVK